jgi:hypothetical protein
MTRRGDRWPQTASPGHLLSTVARQKPPRTTRQGVVEATPGPVATIPPERVGPSSARLGLGDRHPFGGRLLRLERNPDLEDADVIRRLRVIRIGVGRQTNGPLGDPVPELRMVFRLPLLVPLGMDGQQALIDTDLDILLWVYARKLRAQRVLLVVMLSSSRMMSLRVTRLWSNHSVTSFHSRGTNVVIPDLLLPLRIPAGKAP